MPEIDDVKRALECCEQAKVLLTEAEALCRNWEHLGEAAHDLDEAASNVENAEVALAKGLA